MLRRSLLMILVAVMAGFIIAGCGGGESSTGGAIPDQPPPEPTPIIQTTNLSGLVLENDGKTPVSKAYVTMQSTLTQASGQVNYGANVEANASGEFSFSEVPYGNMVFKVWRNKQAYLDDTARNQFIASKVVDIMGNPEFIALIVGQFDPNYQPGQPTPSPTAQPTAEPTPTLPVASGGMLVVHFLNENGSTYQGGSVAVKLHDNPGPTNPWEEYYSSGGDHRYDIQNKSQKINSSNSDIPGWVYVNSLSVGQTYDIYFRNLSGDDIGCQEITVVAGRNNKDFTVKSGITLKSVDMVVYERTNTTINYDAGAGDLPIQQYRIEGTIYASNGSYSCTKVFQWKNFFDTKEYIETFSGLEVGQTYQFNLVMIDKFGSRYHIADPVNIAISSGVNTIMVPIVDAGTQGTTSTENWNGADINHFGNGYATSSCWYWPVTSIPPGTDRYFWERNTAYTISKSGMYLVKTYYNPDSTNNTETQLSRTNLVTTQGDWMGRDVREKDFYLNPDGSVIQMYPLDAGEVATLSELATSYHTGGIGVISKIFGEMAEIVAGEPIYK